MTRRRRQRAKPQSLMITPMIDLFTVILIFLIVNYSPEAAKIKKSSDVKLPKSTINLNKVPHIQVEVGQDYISVNGEKIAGLAPTLAAGEPWVIFKDTLKRVSKKEEDGKAKDQPVLVMADKSTSFNHIDRTVAYMAAAGYSEVYFLTEKQDETQEGN